jgi:hypothetical protein
MPRTEIEKKLRNLLNEECAENGSNTPDFVLSEYLLKCLDAFDAAITRREVWYGRVAENSSIPDRE